MTTENIDTSFATDTGLAESAYRLAVTFTGNMPITTAVSSADALSVRSSVVRGVVTVRMIPTATKYNAAETSTC